MIGMSATVNATACVLACAAHWLMIGFSDSDWKPTPIRGQRTSLSEANSSGGPFAKGDDGIFVGQAYFGYTGFPDFKFTGGRMPQPLITTSMLWDDDINPEGLAEQWKHTFTFNLGGGGGEAVQSYSKEGKAVVAHAAEPFKLKLDVFANFAQFVYDDENPENPIGPNPTTTANGSTPENSNHRTPSCWRGR